MKGIRFSGLCILALLCLLGTNLLRQARAQDVETAKSNARQQISQLKVQINDQAAAIVVADVTVAVAKAALQAEQNKTNPDVGKVFALAITVGFAETAASEIRKQKAASEVSLASWEAYLARLGG